MGHPSSSDLQVELRERRRQLLVTGRVTGQHPGQPPCRRSFTGRGSPWPASRPLRLRGGLGEAEVHEQPPNTSMSLRSSSLLADLHRSTNHLRVRSRNGQAGFSPPFDVDVGAGVVQMEGGCVQQRRVQRGLRRGHTPALSGAVLRRRRRTCRRGNARGGDRARPPGGVAERSRARRLRTRARSVHGRRPCRRDGRRPPLRG